MVRRSVFDQIFREMLNIRLRLDGLESAVSGWRVVPLEVSGSDLMCLPDHLRRTFLVVASRGECSAVVVAGVSGRCRSVESCYLNQLVRMGWLDKRRVSRTLLFRPVSERMPQNVTVPPHRRIGAT